MELVRRWLPGGSGVRFQANFAVENCPIGRTLLDQRGFKLLSLRVSLTLALTPSVKAAAVDAERPATPINAVLLVQLIDQRE